ncbi:MAG: M48 family metallopeptidase [Clostridia bacterium]|nr:M48 family metallopeptidase [Clostridia bacterium]
MMPHIDVLIRTKRKSVSIHITPQGNLVVRAPVKCSNEKILSIVKEKEQWIILHQQRIKNNLAVHQELINLKQVMFLGTTYPLQYNDAIKQISITENALIVPYKYLGAKLSGQVSRWFKIVAEKILFDRIRYFATLMQLDYGELKLSNAKGSWGSCDNKSNIKLNWRLIMLPHSLIDYVVVHELAHILEFNHSKNFWLIVKSVLPDYKERRNQVKKGDFLLQ